MRTVGLLASLMSLTLLLVGHSTSGGPQSPMTPAASGGGQSTLHYPGNAAVPHGQQLIVRSDDAPPPGCLAIVGKPPPTTCLPCPPLWLGGPTIRCISLFQLKEEQRGWRLASYNTGKTLASGGGSFHLALVGDGWGGGWLPACPGVPILPMQLSSARLAAHLCGAGFVISH